MLPQGDFSRLLDGSSRLGVATVQRPIRRDVNEAIPPDAGSSGTPVAAFELVWSVRTWQADVMVAWLARCGCATGCAFPKDNPAKTKDRPQYAAFICSTASSTLMFPAGKALFMTWM